MEHPCNGFVCGAAAPGSCRTAYCEVGEPRVYIVNGPNNASCDSCKPLHKWLGAGWGIPPDEIVSWRGVEGHTAINSSDSVVRLAGVNLSGIGPSIHLLDLGSARATTAGIKARRHD